MKWERSHAIDLGYPLERSVSSTPFSFLRGEHMKRQDSKINILIYALTRGEPITLEEALWQTVYSKSVLGRKMTSDLLQYMMRGHGYMKKEGRMLYGLTEEGRKAASDNLSEKDLAFLNIPIGNVFFPNVGIEEEQASAGHKKTNQNSTSGYTTENKVQHTSETSSQYLKDEGGDYSVIDWKMLIEKPRFAKRKLYYIPDASDKKWAVFGIDKSTKMVKFPGHAYERLVVENPRISAGVLFSASEILEMLAQLSVA